MAAYTWDEIPDEPVRPGVRRRAFGTDEAMLVMNHCEPGMAVRPHSHDFPQIAMIVAGRAIYHVDGEPCAGGSTVSARIRPAALRVRVSSLCA